MTTDCHISHGWYNRTPPSQATLIQSPRGNDINNRRRRPVRMSWSLLRRWRTFHTTVTIANEDHRPEAPMIFIFFGAYYSPHLHLRIARRGRRGIPFLNWIVIRITTAWRVFGAFVLGRDVATAARRRITLGMETPSRSCWIEKTMMLSLFSLVEYNTTYSTYSPRHDSAETEKSQKGCHWFLRLPTHHNQVRVQTDRAADNKRARSRATISPAQ